MRMSAISKRSSLYFANLNFDPNQKICRYMDLDAFLILLDTSNLYIPRKEVFKNGDIQECSLPLKRLFAIQQVGQNVTKQDITEQSAQRKRLFEEYKNCRKLPTSCWSLRDCDNYLMWKSYTSKLGVCVKTTIEHLISSIQTNDYTIVCGKIFYEGYRSNDIADLLFSKRPFYSNEEEFRFYFIKEDNNVSNNYILVPVSIECLIAEVVLSPFIISGASKFIKTELEKKHDFLKGKIHISKISSQID